MRKVLAQVPFLTTEKKDDGISEIKMNLKALLRENIRGTTMQYLRVCLESMAKICLSYKLDKSNEKRKIRYLDSKLLSVIGMITT